MLLHAKPSNTHAQTDDTKGRFCEKLKCVFDSQHLLFKYVLPCIATADKTFPYTRFRLRIYKKHNYSGVSIEDASLLGYDALLIGEWSPMFRRSTLPPSSEYREY